MAEIQPAAVLDTNAFLELHSCHAVFGETNKRDATAIEHPATV